jgi:hypothetical protein
MMSDARLFCLILLFNIQEFDLEAKVSRMALSLVATTRRNWMASQGCKPAAILPPE